MQTLLTLMQSMNEKIDKNAASLDSNTKNTDPIQPIDPLQELGDIKEDINSLDTPTLYKSRLDYVSKTISKNVTKESLIGFSFGVFFSGVVMFMNA